MRAIVCGGRDFADAVWLEFALDSYHPTEICHGGASGADTLAGKWAESRGVPCRVFLADWKRYGNA